MPGLMLPVRFGLRKGRKVLEASVSAGKSQKYQLRRSTSSRTIDGPKIEYPKSVNETKPVTSPRSRIARDEALLPHQSSAWTKHKKATRGY